VVWPSKEEDDARDEVGGDLLQAKADADTQRTAKDGDGGQVDAHDRHQEQEGGAEDGDFGGLDRQFAGGGAEVGLRLDVASGLAVRPGAEPEQAAPRRSGRGSGQGGELDVAEVDLGGVQGGCGGVVEEAQRMQRQSCPRITASVVGDAPDGVQQDLRRQDRGVPEWS
jgi:hypothetical protein